MTRLYIGNLPFSATDEMLRHIFEHVGRVRYARIVKDPASGRSKGFGFVEMATHQEAAEAITRFNGDTYEGRVVVVSEAREREEKPVAPHSSVADLQTA